MDYGLQNNKKMAKFSNWYQFTWTKLMVITFIVIGIFLIKPIYNFFKSPETIEAKLEVEGWGDDENTVILKNAGSYNYAKLTELTQNQLDYLKSGLEEEGGKVFLFIDTLKVKEGDFDTLDDVKRVWRETEKYTTTPPVANVDSIIKARADSLLKAIEDAKPKDTIYVQVSKPIGTMDGYYKLKFPFGKIKYVIFESDAEINEYIDFIDSLEMGIPTYFLCKEFEKDTAGKNYLTAIGAPIFRHRPPGMKNYGGGQMIKPVVEKVEYELADDESAEEEKEKPVAKPEEKKKSKPSASKTNKNNKSVGNKGRKIGG